MSKKDDKPPHIRLAVENEKRDVERHRAEFDLHRPLKQLAANLIRIVRGAGAPHEFGSQCADVVTAYREYYERVGEWPRPYVVSDILSIRHRENLAKTERAMEWEDAIQQMIAGGLQAAASQLLGQRMQERAGESEMFDGLRVIERQREENRAALARSGKSKAPGRHQRKQDPPVL